MFVWLNSDRCLLCCGPGDLGCFSVDWLGGTLLGRFGPWNLLANKGSSVLISGFLVLYVFRFWLFMSLRTC